MDEKRVQELFQQYRREIESLTGMLSDIGNRGDLEALNWAIQLFHACSTVALRHIKEQMSGDDLVRHESFH